MRVICLMMTALALGAVMTWADDGDRPNRGGNWQQILQNADKNGDGKIDRDEWPGRAETFDRLDRNGDGVIDEVEMPGGRGDGPGGRFGQMDPGQRWQAMLERFDANDDGRISEDEFEGPDKVFGFLDRNNDGVITEDEGKAAPPPPPGEGPQGPGADRPGNDPAAYFKRMLERWDADGDGKLGRDEWKGRAEMFEQLDADGDTFVTEQEFAEGAARIMKRRNPAEELLGMMDTDADGRLSEDEWSGFFKNADENGDGFLSHDELMKAMRPQRDAQGPPPGGGPPAAGQ